MQTVIKVLAIPIIIFVAGLFLIIKNLEQLPTIDPLVNKTVVEVTENTSSAKVIRVIDGDTVKVAIQGHEETVRVIGINTPETVDPRRSVECFGQEATNEAHRLLDDAMVILEIDDSQGERDKYGRLLRYLTLSDGGDFGEIMIRHGFAYEYTYEKPYLKQILYQEAEEEARSSKNGLWSAQAQCEQ